MAPQTRSQTRQYRVETVEKIKENTNTNTYNTEWSNWSWLWYLIMMLVMTGLYVWINTSEYKPILVKQWSHYFNCTN